GGLVRDDVGLACAEAEVPNGGAQLPEVAAVAHPAGLDHDGCGGQAGVVPGLDGGGAGVGGLTPDGEPRPRGGLDSLARAHVAPGPGEDGALLDVTLDVGVGDGTPLAGVAVEADADELVLDGLAGLVGELVGVVERDAPGSHRRAEHVGAEPDALFLG